MKHIPTSIALFERAQRSIPGGVNSPVRAFKSVGGTPVFFRRAVGAHLYDADGNVFIDYINSWGPMILGHGHPAVIEAVERQVREAFTFGAPTEREVEMAELICRMAPNVDQVRLVSSGTEACMSAIRLARGYTGRNKIIKFEGCYHGHADAFLVKAGSGVATFGIQNVPGVTEGVAQDTLTAPYNDLPALEALMGTQGKEIAAVIVEPVAGNMGCIPPQPGYLEGMRALCNRHGAVLIFDEVMTGFRLARGGAQERLSVDADLLTFGKVIGGGFPVGAFGGKKEIMQHLAPAGSVYQAGTLSGNPVATAAGFATLSRLDQHPEIYDHLDRKTQQLGEGLAGIFSEKGIAHTINRLGSMISVHFGEEPVTDFASASRAGIGKFKQFFHHMLNEGIYLPPSAYESWFISDALSEEDVERTLAAAARFEPKDE
jgi:glutamate-1-semialdehyde 2,1-aminomutase